MTHQIHHHEEKGFSAIELLITLFIATAFIATGYQLYNAIILTSGAAQAQARANNIAYEYLRRYENSASIQTPCVASTPLSNSSLDPVGGLSNVRITVAVSCPGTPSSLSKIAVTLTYGYGSESGEVRHALFVTP